MLPPVQLCYIIFQGCEFIRKYAKLKYATLYSGDFDHYYPF